VSLTVERTFHLGSRPGRKGGYRRVVQEGPEPEPLPPAPMPGRTPRISRLMALAIRCDQLLRSGAVPDATALASLAHVTQPRMTQILNLTLLAPDIQEALLCLPAVVEGKPEISEKGLRPVCAEVDWERQRGLVSGQVILPR
jgi:hypothetical protein